MKKTLSILLSLLTIFSAVFVIQNVPAEDIVDVNEQYTGDYFKQYSKNLYDKNQIKLSNEKITLTQDTKTNNVIFSCKKEDIIDSYITIDKKFNFDKNTVDRFSFVATSKRGTDVKLGFFLDDESEPFLDVKLLRQKKKKDWSFSKNTTVDISDKKISGEHTLKIKVLDCSDNTAEFGIEYFEFVESSVPVMYINIDESMGSISDMNNSYEHTEECYGNFELKVPENYISEYTGKVLTGGKYEMEYIRGRGNSTWGAPKKPYKIKLEKKADLLGLGKNKHWVLLANYYDNSLLRNKITYWIGEQLGMEYTPQSEPVDVVMNGKYLGSYFLCEQIRVGENRVEIDDLEKDEETMHSTDPDVITGGYLLGLEPYGDEDKKSFYTDNGKQFLIESPSFEDYYNEEQYNYIKNYVQETENAIYGDNFKTKDGKSYKDLLDVKSTVLYYWLQEFSMNGDGYISTSSYMYKKRNDKLYFGPLWDFDYVAWGSTEYDTSYTTGWSKKDSMWLEQLFKDKSFVQEVINQWPNLKAALEEVVKPGGQLDYYKNRMSATAAYNFEELGMSPLNYSWDSYYSDSGTNNNLTYDQEIERLRTWIKDRMTWVDENVNDLIPQTVSVPFKVDGKVYKTLKGVVGDAIGTLPKAPAKKGYTFKEWQATVKLSFDEYINEFGLYDSYEEEIDEDLIESIKKNGYKYTFKLTKNHPFRKNMYVNAKYIKNSSVINPKKIFFSRSKYTIALYEPGYQTFNIQYQLAPYNATKSSVKWSSSNTKIATINSSGLVTMKKTGKVTITATAPNNVKKSCTFEILDGFDDPKYESGMKFSKKEYTIYKGQYTQIPTKFSSTGAYIDELYVKALDSSIVKTYNANVVYGRKVGTTVLTGEINGTTSVCVINVIDKNQIVNGKVYTRNGIKYKVTSVTGKTLQCIGVSNKKMKAANIPDTITLQKKKFKVTSIASNAFKNMSKLQKVTIGRNVEVIKNKAFNTCKNLKTIRIKGYTPKIYKYSFYKLNKKVKIYKNCK